jgi:hypothetical protein
MFESISVQTEREFSGNNILCVAMYSYPLNFLKTMHTFAWLLDIFFSSPTVVAKILPYEEK